MAFTKTTYLIYGIEIPRRRLAWDEEPLILHLEGRGGVASSLVMDDDKAYFGLVLHSTSGKYERHNAELTGWWNNNKERIQKAQEEIKEQFGVAPNQIKLLMVDTID